jgi:hypothetical protein
MINLGRAINSLFVDERIRKSSSLANERNVNPDCGRFWLRILFFNVVQRKGGKTLSLNKEN